MRRNPRWIIFCIAECVEHGSIGLGPRGSLGNYAQVTRTYREAAH